VIDASFLQLAECLNGINLLSEFLLAVIDLTGIWGNELDSLMRIAVDDIGTVSDEYYSPVGASYGLYSTQSKEVRTMTILFSDGLSHGQMNTEICSPQLRSLRRFLILTSS